MEVIFSEVLAPMGYTMDLINYEAVDLIQVIEMIKCAHESGALNQPLRCQIHQLILESLDLGVYPTDLSLFLGRVPTLTSQGCSWYPEFQYEPEVIFYQ